MKQEHKDLLKRACDAFCDQWDENLFNMDNYYRDSNKEVSLPTAQELEKPFCGTSCCFAGALPFLGIDQLKPVDEDFYGILTLNYNKYSRRLFGFSFRNDYLWQLLFDPEWPSTKEHLRRRVALVLSDSEEYDLENYKIIGDEGYQGPR